MSNSFSFNLLDERWIPCLAAYGKPEELSLAETLARAPQLQEIVDASPLVTAALHRLLIAILHRCFGPKTDQEWQRLWERASFDMEVVEGYLGRWKHRFDLFDTERPFYQTPVEMKPVSVSKLAHERNDKHATILFDHSVEDEPAPMTPADAARHLLAVQAFALGGTISRLPGEGPSADAALLAKGLVVLLTGTNLFETLLLNLSQLDGSSGQPFEFEPSKDLPAWEQNSPAQPKDRYPYGYLDLLTWQSRRLHCLPSLTETGAVVIQKTVVAKGWQFPDGFELRTKETMVPYKKNRSATAREEPWRPLQLSRDRVLWRDSVALLQRVSEASQPIRSIEWLAHLQTIGLLQTEVQVSLSVFGLLYDPQKTASMWLWRHERLPLPRLYLTEPDLAAELSRSIQLAEDAGRLFKKGAYSIKGNGKERNKAYPLESMARCLLFPDGKNIDFNRTGNLMDSLAAERPYWAALDTPFRKLMIDLADAWPRHEQDVPIGEWAQAIQRSATNAFEAAARSLETSGRGLRAAAEARGQFGVQLHHLLAASLPTAQV